MTVPDPRFRDQFAEVLHEWMGGDRDYYDAPAAALLPLIAAEVEASVQAAAKQGAAEGVTPAEIVRQRSLGWPDMHPEDYCHQCGRPNPTWFADTAEWQTATGSTGDGGGILCPSCFCALWEEVAGKTAIVWRLSIDPRSRDARPAEPPGELREQIRDELAQHEPQYHDGYLTGEPDWFSCGSDDESGRGCEWASDPESEDDWATRHRQHIADALLSGPLAPLLAAEATVKRVESLRGQSMLTVAPFDEFDPPQRSVQAVSLEQLRRALGGPQ